MGLVYQGVVLSDDHLSKIQALGSHYDIKWEYLVTQLWVETQWGTHPAAISARADNNWSGMTWSYDGDTATRLSGVEVTRGLLRPSIEGGNYIHYQSLDDFFKDWVFLLRKNGAYNVADTSSIEDYTKGLFKAGGAQYDYAASGYEHYVNLMRPAYLNIFSKNGGNDMSKALQAIKWFEDRRGKVSYSMDYRNGPNSYDCSSAVYSALIYAGILPKNTWLGNTETLYALEGKLLIPIKRSEIKKGDIFVSGVKGQSLGSGGHTGMVYDANRIIHCNYYDNGITITQIDGRSGTPLYFYRIKGTESTAKYDAVKMTFKCDITELRVHSDTVGTASVVDKMTKGVTKYIDRTYNVNGYKWGSYISYKGDRRYFPIETSDGSRKFGTLTNGYGEVKETPAASIKQDTGKVEVLDEDYNLVIKGEKYKLVKQ